MYEFINKNRHTVGASTLTVIIMLVNPTNSVAALPDSHNTFYLNASGHIAVGKDNDHRSELYRHGGGFHLSETIDIGIADVYLGNQKGESSTRGAEVYLRRLAAVGDLAKLYVDAGATTFGDHFSVGAGMLYSLNDHVDIDVGYRYYADASVAQGDTYSFGLGLQYNFADRAMSVMQGPQTPPVQSRAAEPEPEVVKPVLRVIEAEPKEQSVSVCSKIWRSPNWFVDNSQTTVRYEIQEGDGAIRIARRHCTTLDVLMALNPWLVPRVAENKYIYPKEVLIVPSLSE